MIGKNVYYIDNSNTLRQIKLADDYKTSTEKEFATAVKGFETD